MNYLTSILNMRTIKHQTWSQLIWSVGWSEITIPITINLIGRMVRDNPSIYTVVVGFGSWHVQSWKKIYSNTHIFLMMHWPDGTSYSNQITYSDQCGKLHRRLTFHVMHACVAMESYIEDRLVYEAMCSGGYGKVRTTDYCTEVMRWVAKNFLPCK